LDVSYEKDILFSQLRDAEWKTWPGKVLKMRWQGLKERFIAGHEQRSHREVVEMLVERCPKPEKAEEEV
jgi:hypothetical protein